MAKDRPFVVEDTPVFDPYRLLNETLRRRLCEAMMEANVAATRTVCWRPLSHAPDCECATL